MNEFLTTLDTPTAKLLQIGLKELGYYSGTTAGRPGPKTSAAFERYLEATKEKPDQLSLAQIVANIAEREVGVREDPQDSNRGQKVEQYQRATWLGDTGWPWCAAFVCWCIREAGSLYDLTFQRPRTAGAWDFIRWAEGQGLVNFDPRGNDDLIQRGDIVVFTFSHIGICNATTETDHVNTVEGNTDASGSREGGGVYKKVRKRSQIRRVIRLEEASA